MQSAAVAARTDKQRWTNCWDGGKLCVLPGLCTIDNPNTTMVWGLVSVYLNIKYILWILEREQCQTAVEYRPSLWRGCSAYHCSGILRGDTLQGSERQKHNKWTWSPTWSLNTAYHSRCSAARLWLLPPSTRSATLPLLGSHSKDRWD